MTISYPLAFGIGNLWMLGWLAAAAAPLLIHLWNRRKHREISWAAMEYLLAALRKNSRRLRLEQLLLLIIRTLIIVLIVMAVAQPFLESAGLSFVGAQRALKILIVDGSYSMAYKPTDKSRFDRAKQLASQIVDESNQGDAFALIVMAEPPQMIVGTPAMDRRSVQDEIENLHITHGRGDLVATLAKVEQVLASSEAVDMPRREIYFLTDLGRTSWSPDNDRESAAIFRQRVEQLAERASLIAIDLGQDGSENLSITSALIKQPFVLTSQPAEIEIQVKNFGRQPHNGQVVELLAGDRRVGQAKIDIPAGGQATAMFQHRWDAPGDYALEVRLAADLLDLDNHRYLALPVKQSLDVLVVDGKPGSGQFTGAGDYVALALSPEQRPSGASPVKVELISESLLQERELSQYDCVFLCNIAQFTTSEALMLDNYLKQGGGLIFFLGDRVLPERYNRELASQMGPHIFPVELGEAVQQGDYHFDPLDYRHALVRAFQGSEQSGLLTTPVYKYMRLKIPDGSSSKIALAFDTGDPAIVEEPIGRGRSIVVATDGSLSSVADSATKTPWTTMAAWPSFVPIVHELLSWGVTQQRADRNSLVGQPIGGEAPISVSSQSLSIRVPNGREASVQSDSAVGTPHWSFSDTFLSGIYAFSTGSAGAELPFAVNVDTSEGDLSRIVPSELPSQFVTSQRSNLDDASSTSVTRQTGFHRSLLYIVLGLLLMESLLAWRFGNSGN